MEENIIKIKSEEFALEIVRLYKFLQETKNEKTLSEIRNQHRS